MFQIYSRFIKKHYQSQWFKLIGHSYKTYEKAYDMMKELKDNKKKNINIKYEYKIERE